MKHDIMGQLDQKYDKICMITVEKGLLISGRKGIKVWNKLMEMNMRQVEQCLQDDRLHLYRDTLWCFYFAADRSYPADLFLQKAEMIFRECGYCFDGECRLIAVNRFYVVVDEENPMEKIQLCMSEHCSSNLRFCVYNPNNTEMLTQTDEMLFMTNIIQDAILHDRIVPYFQPIRDNRTHKIQKYEALMRLSDADRNIYAPGQFLEIAKDYHLYLQLSQMMIRKVLQLFRDREETVFLNLSAYDIESEENRTFLLNLLEETPLAVRKRVTFELLESERIQHMDNAVEFLEKLRALGAKIAIDDFGVGYSNFSELIRVSPDFIKIDGELVIDCDKNPVKQICLQAITQVAKGIDAELIAEHVESSSEQATVESICIDYTQGYYFSKPVPFSHLEAQRFAEA